MTVKELIEKLQKLQPDLEVIVDGSYADLIGPLESVEVEKGQVYLRDWGGPL